MVAFKQWEITGSENSADLVKTLVIYTGGTLGMIYSEEKSSLVPFQFSQFLEFVPEIKRINSSLTVLEFENPIDSSNMNPSLWLDLANIIGERYGTYDSFVILHGTDTMAYTASALSFLFQNLGKPVIITGAQLPIGVPRTDARENLITTLEIAALAKTYHLPEVVIYFNGELLRGNRAKKYESEQFDAFVSENYPVLGEIGVSIQLYKERFLRRTEKDSSFVWSKSLKKEVLIIKIFPGFDPSLISISKSVRGVVLETFGSGNAPTTDTFKDFITRLITAGIIVYNVSQCTGGAVDQKHYATGRSLERMGVVSGRDISLEAAITKLMYVLGLNLDQSETKRILGSDLRGELTE